VLALFVSPFVVWFMLFLVGRKPSAPSLDWARIDWSGKTQAPLTPATTSAPPDVATVAIVICAAILLLLVVAFFA
jgi:hypothetical protein